MPVLWRKITLFFQIYLCIFKLTQIIQIHALINTLTFSHIKKKKCNLHIEKHTDSVFSPSINFWGLNLYVELSPMLKTRNITNIPEALSCALLFHCPRLDGRLREVTNHSPDLCRLGLVLSDFELYKNGII